MRTSIRGLSAAAIASAAIAIPACDGTPGGSSEVPPPAGCQATTAVWLLDSGFGPPCVSIAPGATVTFRNADTVHHTVTAFPGQPETFDSRLLAPGQEFSHTFASTAERVEVRCSLHPSSVGLVLVR